MKGSTADTLRDQAVMGWVHFGMPRPCIVVALMAASAVSSPGQARSYGPLDGGMHRELDAQRTTRTRQLVSAAESGNFGRVLALVNAGADVNVRVRAVSGSEYFDRSFRDKKSIYSRATLLSYCIARGQRKIVFTLLQRHASINARGDIVLITARDSDARYVEFLRDVTSLHVAAALGDVAVVSRLVRLGARIDCQDDLGSTALAMAVRHRRTETSGALINAGANVNVANQRRETPLIVAAQYGNRLAVKQLLGARAAVGARDANRRTALYWAVMGANVEIARDLISAGSEVNAVDVDGYSALRRAAETGDQVLYDCLKAAGAKGVYTVRSVDGIVK